MIDREQQTKPAWSLGEIAEYLTEGYWLGEEETPATWDLDARGGEITIFTAHLDDETRTLIGKALAEWSRIGPFSFKHSYDDPDIIFFNEADGAFTNLVRDGDQLVNAYVNVNWSLYAADPRIGTEGYFQFLHEIGHALGLGHPGPYNFEGTYAEDAIFRNDTYRYSVMSYFHADEEPGFDGPGHYPLTLMPADIVALMNLYRPGWDISEHWSHEQYDDRYFLDPAWYVNYLDDSWWQYFRDGLAEGDGAQTPAMLTIYDTGGRNELLGMTDAANEIDLRDGALSWLGDRTYAVVLMPGTVIVNAQGGEFDDRLIGNEYVNWLRGYAGNDVIEGGAGWDTQEGHDGNDILLAGAGDDIVRGGAGDDLLTGHAGNDKLIDGSGDDRVTGNRGDDWLYVSAGNDHLDGGSGTDTLDLGTAKVTLRVDLRLIEQVFGDGLGTDRIVSIENAIGSRQADVLIGTEYRNELGGGGGSDRILGLGGDDRLSGHGGGDTILGGAGDDWINAGRTGPAAHLEGNRGNDTLQSGTGDDVLLGGLGDDLLLPGGGNDQMRGGHGIDTVSYKFDYFGIEAYLSFGTRDRIGEHSGWDTFDSIENLIGARGDDRLVGTPWANRIEGGKGNDIIKGKGGADILLGEAGDDRIVGGGEVDSFHGRDGSDTLIALSGDDVLKGGAGDDFLYGGRDTDRLHGGAGDDRLRGNLGTDWLYGEEGNDDLRGGSSNDVLMGGDGDDHLYGGNSRDTLFGGRGSDVMSGADGAGARDGCEDRFVFTPFDSVDTNAFDIIRDFEDGLDIIDLTAFAFSDFAELQTLSEDFGSQLRIRLDVRGGEALIVPSMSMDLFDTSDVVLI